MSFKNVLPALALMVPSMVFADSISPATFSANLNVGQSVTINKTVTVSQQLTVPLDVFFLTDTTGSMGSSIFNIQSNFTSILNNLSSIAPDVRFGAGEYKDRFDVFAYRLNQDLTADKTAVTNSINSWFASGGGDLPEANLYALEQAANTTSWRTGSQRFMIWAGDAPGHDPRLGSTEASAIAALNAKGISVISVSADSGPGIDETGQATRISNATGGSFLGTVNSSAVASAISSALTSALTFYSRVELMGMGVPPGVSVELDPAITGAFDRSIERVFNFDVKFTGVTPGTYNFAINALVDGRVIATELDSITVGGDEVPEPSTYALIGVGLGAVAVFRKKNR